MNDFALTFVIVFSVLVGGCASREAKPVETDQPLDARLSCSHLHGERENNIKRLEELTGESRDKVAQNIGSILLLNPFLMDLSNTQKKEAEAIYARNQRIEELLAENECEDT